MEVVAPEILSADEIRDVTGYARAAQQAAWLRERCVPHRLEGRRVILSRHHFREWLEGRSRPVGNGINWSAVR